jgi:hypothetical protein
VLDDEDDPEERKLDVFDDDGLVGTELAAGVRTGCGLLDTGVLLYVLVRAGWALERTGSDGRVVAGCLTGVGVVTVGCLTGVGVVTVGCRTPEGVARPAPLTSG